MNDSIILFLGGLLGFLLGFAASLPNIKRILQIHQTSHYSADTLSDEKIVEVSGYVPTETRSIHSPLTQTACVLWHVEIQEHKSSGDDSYWETIFNETSAHSFDIQDATGIVRIYPMGAELILHDDFYKESGPFVGTFEPTLQTAVEKLVSSSIDSEERTRPLRVREQIIRANETVYVLGKIKEKNSVQVISSSTGGSSFLISDRSQGAVLGRLYLYAIASIFLLIALGIFIAQQVANQI